MPRLDLRLAIPAIGCWSITWLGISSARGVLVVAILLSLGCVGGGAAALAGCTRCESGHGRRESGHGRGMAGAATIVLATAGLTGGAGIALLIRADRVDAHPLRQLAGAAVTAVVSPIEDPKVGSRSPELVWARVRLHAVDGRSVPAATAVLFASNRPGAPSGRWLDLRVGQRARGVVTVRIPEGRGLVVAQLTARGPPTVVAEAPGYLRLAEAVRGRFRAVCADAVGHRAAGLLPGLVVGDTSMGEAEVEDQFRRAGLTHLSAVSGANFALIVGAAVLVFAVVGGSLRTTAIAGLAATIAFAVLTQLSPSVIRAAIMGGIGLLAMAGSRSRDAMPALAAAVALALLVWPELAVDAGFAMSVAATAALIAWSPVLRDRLVGHRWPRGAADAVAMATVAFVVTAPLVALISGRVSLTAVLANIAVAPVIPVVTVLGALALVLAAIDVGAATAMARLLVVACEPGLWWILRVARFLGGRWAAVPAGPLWVLLVIVAAIVGRSVLRRRSGDKYSPFDGRLVLVRIPRWLAAVRRPDLPGRDRTSRPRNHPR
ncbi:MAG: ComEC/Rec2 family competence protein [Gordonia sp. (in: high G+C Gram-positive bacteria)]|uniref:ComEC/Rec2 family competence protein n=1 Tax=Gordonia sp. (in: high G+C Gram-positive bacteria) TaxID=84139 RepID=UPI0039E4C101